MLAVDHVWIEIIDAQVRLLLVRTMASETEILEQRADRFFERTRRVRCNPRHRLLSD
jgi:hypothetical protein